MADAALKLSAAEQSYFDSRGEEAPPEKVAPEAAPAEQAEPAQGDTGEEPAAKPEPVRDEKGKFVPHGALHEERERRKAAEERVKQLQDGILARLDRLGTAETPAQPEKSLAQLADEDPIAAVKRLAEQQEQAQHQTAEQQRQQQFISGVMSAYQAKVQEFQAEAPDFMAAYRHLYAQRERELQRFGLTDKARLRAAMQSEELALVAGALQQGMNPAALLYETAKERGYRKAEAKVEAEPETEKLETVSRGQQAGRSVGQMGGGAKPPISLETLAKMSDDEFLKQVKNGTFQKLFGG